MYIQLLLWGNFQDFIEQAFMFNFNSYIPSEESAPIRFINFIKAMFRPRMLPLFALLLLGLASTFFKIKQLTKFHFVLFGALLLQMWSGSMSGRHYPHYYLMLLPFIVFLLVFNIKDFKFQGKLWPMGIVAVLLGYVLIKSIFMFKLSSAYPLNSEVHKIVKSVEDQEGQFYTFDKNHLGVNTDLEIIAPSKWIYTQFAYTDYDPNGNIIKDILEGFEYHQTKFILYPNDFNNQSVEDYLNLNYSSVHNTPKFDLFKRND